MKIISLLENTSNTNLKPKHGLCLYIETLKHKILFDLGPDETYIKNAKLKKIDLEEIDIVIISHGHIDHGGGLKSFLKIDSKAKIYIQESAFRKYYSKFLFIYINIGLKNITNNRIVMINGDYKIDENIRLFTSKGNELPSPMNKNLLDENKNKDKFIHEQNLIIKENKVVLIMGCGHNGVINILESAKEPIDICIGGFHLYDPITKQSVDKLYLDNLGAKLNSYKTCFYTCHCTGKKNYSYLSSKNKNIKYLSCGEEIDIWWIIIESY